MDMTMILSILGGLVLGALVVFVLMRRQGASSSTPAVEAPPAQPFVSSGNAQADIERLKAELQQAQQAKAERDKQLDLLRQREAELQKTLEDNLKKGGDAGKAAAEELENLRKALKKAQNDYDDLQDEAEDDRKKVKKVTAQLDEATAKQEAAEQQVAELQGQLTQTTADRDEAQKLLANKAGQLALVGTLLDAEEVKAEGDEAVTVARAADQIFDFIENDFADACAVIKSHRENFFAGYDPDPNHDDEHKDGQAGYDNYYYSWLGRYYDWASVAKKRWLYNKKTIAFVGEFSAGKTSIVNTILKQNDPSVAELPVSMKATTAIPTYVAGAGADLCQFVAPDGAIRRISTNDFAKFNKETLAEMKGVPQLVRYFVLGYKNPKLNALSILDTPGFSSNDSKDAERTVEVINECDALFWVLDVNAGTINRSSLLLIKEHLHRPLYIVVNKVDSKSEQAVDQEVQLIRDTLNREQIPFVDIVRYSYKMQPDVLLDVIAKVERNAGRSTFVADFREDMQDTLDIFKKNQADVEADLKRAAKEREGLIEEFNEILNQMRDNCSEAADIPHWETHIFGKDRFEMSGSEGERMIECLKTAYNKSNDLVANSDKCDDKLKEITYRNTLIDEVTSDLRMLEHCLERYDEITKPLQNTKI